MSANDTESAPVSGSGDEDVLDRITHIFTTYFGLTIGAVGIIVNFISVLVFTKYFTLFKSSAIYFLLLSYWDSVAIVFTVFLGWINTNAYAYDISFDLLSLNQWTCRFCKFMRNVSGSVSSYLVVLLTLERSLSVIMPEKARLYVTKSRRVKCIVVSCVAIVIVWAQSFIAYDIRSYGKMRLCMPSTKNPLWFQVLFPLEEAVLIYTVPALVVLVANFAASSMFNKSMVLRRELSAESYAKQSRQRRDISTTMLLLSVQYCITYMPIAVIRPVYYAMSSLGNGQYDQKLVAAMVDLVQIARTVSTINFSFNFFFYVWKLKAFRDIIVKFWRRQDVGEAASMTPAA